MFTKKKSTLKIIWKLYPQLFYDEKVRCQFKNVHFSLNSFMFHLQKNLQPQNTYSRAKHEK